MTNLDIVHNYVNAWNNRNADDIVATFSVEGTYHDAVTAGPITGDAIKGYVSALWEAFPDLNFEEVSAIESGEDAVSTQWIMRGTNLGSMKGLPPTGKFVEVEGADFFTLKDGKIESVRGYFDSTDIPRQIGLDILIQPSEIGPFRFGESVCVQTGKTHEPGAFSITYLEAVDNDAVENIRELSTKTMVDMLGMEGFIGATTSRIGTRLVTISAWDTTESSRALGKSEAHTIAMKSFYKGNLAKGGYASVWTQHRRGPFYSQCESCGKMNIEVKKGVQCECGADHPEQLPFW